MDIRNFGIRTSLICMLVLLPVNAVWAETEVTGADYSTSAGGDITITLRTSGDIPNVSVFETESPARIVLDMADTSSSVDSSPVTVGQGSVESFTTLAAGGRTRLLVDLSRPVNYDYNAESGQIVLLIAGSRTASVADSVGRFRVDNVDFKRGPDGQSQVIVSLNRSGANVAVSAGTGELAVDIFNAELPSHLDQRLNVVDFATPVQLIDAGQHGSGVRLVLDVKGSFDHQFYQSDTDLVVEVMDKPMLTATDPNDLVQLYEEKTYTGSRVTFNFQDIPVRSVLQLIADVADLNIVVADNVAGSLTLRLTNVPWDQALDIILDARNLDKRSNGNVIWIAPTADIANREQQILRALQDRQELEPLQTALISVSYATAQDLRDLIEQSQAAGLGNNEGGLLSERGSVAIDERTNTLLVTDTADRIEEIQRLVMELDHPVRQVQIESRIVVANSDFSHDIGVRFGVSALHEGSNILAVSSDGDGADLLNPATDPRADGLLDIPGVPDRYNVNLPATAGSAGTIGLSFFTGSTYLIDLELSALEAEGEGEVISTPRIVTANQAEAFIQQGVEIPYEEATSSGATSVSFKEAVLELRATPLITPDNRIQLELEVKQDTVGAIFQTARGGSVPSIDTRELATSVLVDNGETVVLGGIFQDEKNRQMDRVPYLSSIPGLGNLFRRRSNSNQKRELLIFVTPTIVEDRTSLN